MSHDYTPEELKTIQAIVGASTSLIEARKDIAAHLGIPEFTGDMLQKLYRRREWGTPTASLAAGGGRMVDVSGLDYEEPSTTAPGVHPDIEDVTPCREYVDAPELKRFVVPSIGSSRWLFIPDTHVPYTSRKAWRTMIAAAREWRPDGIVIMGDFADCASVSFHDRSPHRPSRLAGEVDAVNYYLDEVDSLGAKHKLFVEGNHCYRLQRYITEKASALIGLKGLTIPELFRLSERGWSFVRYLSTFQIGDCLVTHTTEKRGGVLAHRKARDAFNATAVVGHNHGLRLEARSDYFGRVVVGMSVGHLFDLDTIDYEHKAAASSVWTHGFGIGVLDHAAQRMHLTPVSIVDGSCSIMGQVVRAA